MSGVNMVVIVGHAGKDAEVRYVPAGDAVATFSVATSYKPKDGEEKTEWHRVIAWGRLGEIAGEYIHKGKQVYVQGRLQTREWTDREGVKRYATEIVAERIQLLGGGKREDGDAPARPAAQSAPAKKNVADLDDDIPF